MAQRRGAGRSPEISPLEAQLTQVLAAAVAAGLARVESEAQASRRRVQFEQFFTSDLVAALDSDPALLEGREREVTVLFADIRGFSAVSERLSPRLTCELVRDVMEHLTARIMESAGVVVDYVGDGLLAMWNAPLEQPDHAVRACRAALAMRDGLPELNRNWQDRLRGNLGLGSASTQVWPWWGTRAATRNSSMVLSGILSIWPVESRGRPSTWA